MKSYWLHILESKSSQLALSSTYLLILASMPDRNVPGGSLPTCHYGSWELLAQKLSSVGIPDILVRDAKEKLDSGASPEIREVILSDEQLEHLGFRDVKGGRPCVSP